MILAWGLAHSKQSFQALCYTWPVGFPGSLILPAHVAGVGNGYCALEVSLPSP